MENIKLLKKPFNMCEVKHVPEFLAPYSFVISMPNKLILICPASELPKEVYKMTETCSCFVLEEDTTSAIMKTTNSIAEILSNANIDPTVMLVNNMSYIFVKADDAMNTVMLLSSMAYDIKYSDFF